MAFFITVTVVLIVNNSSPPVEVISSSCVKNYFQCLKLDVRMIIYKLHILQHLSGSQNMFTPAVYIVDNDITSQLVFAMTYRIRSVTYIIIRCGYIQTVDSIKWRMCMQSTNVILFDIAQLELKEVCTIILIVS